MKLLVCLAAVAPLAAQQSPRSLTLREALEMADRLSPEVAAARLRVVEREAVRESTRAAYLPQATVLVGGTYQTGNLQGIGLVAPGLPSRLGPFRTFNARPVVTQTILDFSLLEEIRASRRRRLESEFEAKSVKETTLLAVTELYLRHFQAHSRTMAAEARARTAEAAMVQARDFEAAGTASKLDVARAVELFRTERVIAAEARREAGVLKTLLSRTIGIPPEQPLELAAPDLRVDASPAGGRELIREATAGRDELRALAARQSAIEHEVRGAVRQRMPRLSFSGDFGVLGAGPDQSLSTWTVGAALTIPVWTSGRIAGEVKAARSRLEQVRQEQRKARLQISQEVSQALVERQTSLSALREAEQAVAAARESLELARLRFASGIATNLDTVTAQGTFAIAEDNEIRARYDCFLAAARLARALGNTFGFLD